MNCTQNKLNQPASKTGLALKIENVKTKEINQIGIVVGGEATLSLWGGGTGTIEMEEYFLPLDKVTPKNILRCVNDNGFGVESIDAAKIDLYIKYDNGSKEYDRTIIADSKIHSAYFLGWKELREQGIKV